MRSGLLLMLWGFIKKLVIADPLARIVNTVYSDPHKFGADPLVLVAATLAFSVQIYCDFSGYTDIVRGSARLFGVDLLQNFDRPYESRSIREFWRRWHMTLMSWFKDYVYIPLGGSRVSPWRRRVNILTVFLVSGLWHGAGFTFIVWGLLNGAYQIVGEWLTPLRERIAGVLHLGPDSKIRAVFATIITFGLITIAWVFFRAESLRDALYILRTMVGASWTPHTNYALGHIGLTTKQLAVVAVATAFMFIAEWVSGRVDMSGILQRQNVAVRWFVYQAGILLVVIFGYYGAQYDAASFAYFKF
jgi:D-alanyl-lipoteichoic acid acyltransferase DltB (MBOAT superfamily)